MAALALVLGQVDLEGQSLSSLHKEELVLFPQRCSGAPGWPQQHALCWRAVLEKPGELYGRAKAGQDLGDGAQQWLLKLKKQIIKCSTDTMLENLGDVWGGLGGASTPNRQQGGACSELALLTTSKAPIQMIKYS